MDIGNHELLVRELAIPPRPEVVTVLFEEMASDSPDLARVTRHIAHDVGLAAAMLKAANSPLFRRASKISSVKQAVDLLGMRNVSSIATGLVIRNAIGGEASLPELLRFWEAAESVALLCGHLARELRCLPADEAFTYGLFHDCGIPMLLQRFPRYGAALEMARAERDSMFTQVEDRSIGTNHAVVGYFMARSWGLEEGMSKAILHHHDHDAFVVGVELPERTPDFIALGHLAEWIHHQLVELPEPSDWWHFRYAVQEHLQLDDERLLELLDEAGEVLAA